MSKIASSSGGDLRGWKARDNSPEMVPSTGATDIAWEKISKAVVCNGCDQSAPIGASQKIPIVRWGLRLAVVRAPAGNIVDPEGVKTSTDCRSENRVGGA